ncbi:MAG: tetratricopeptide repeat protein, partial [Candidatus Thermoplasmatota archaeon]
DKILEKEKGEEVLIERGDTLLKLGRDIEALASYKNALVLLMKYEKYDDGIRCYEKVIKITPEPELYFELAELLIKAQRFEDALACYNKVSSIFPDEPKISEGLERLKEAKEMKKIEDFCKRILEIEGKIDRELSKEEAFKDAKIPFEYLEKVMKYIRSEVEVNIDELKEIEEKPSAEILKKYNIEKLKLSNILTVFPKYSIERAKKLLSYIKTVNESSIDIGIVDVSFEENVRKALEIEKENRNIQNICAKLGIGIYEGKKVEKLLSQLKDEVNVTKISKLEEKKIELPPEKISREISRIEEREKTFLPQTTKKDEKKEIKKKIDMEFWRDTI